MVIKKMQVAEQGVSPSAECLRTVICDARNCIMGERRAVLVIAFLGENEGVTGT